MIASQAIRRIAGVTGRPEATVRTVAGDLGRVDPPLFVRTGRGRSTNAPHLRLSDGPNLTVALCCEPLSLAPRLVPAYRGLPVEDARWPPAARPDRPEAAIQALGEWHEAVSSPGLRNPARFRLLPGATFGEALDGLVDWIARPKGGPVRRHLKKLGFWADVLVGVYMPVCTVGLASEDGSLTYRTDYLMHGGFWPWQVGTTAHPGFTTTVRIHFDVFETLADIWTDTLAHHGGDLPPPSHSRRSQP